MYPQLAHSSRMMAGHWDEDGHSDRPSTRSSNEPPDHAAHMRSRSTALAHTHSHSPKRLSVFSGRSRSNTTASTSSRRSPGSSMASVDSPGPSQDERVPTAMGMRAEKERSRSILSRGSRMLRRQGSKINIVAEVAGEREPSLERPRPDSPSIFSRRPRRANQHDRLKSIISDPFDFHHLTHTNPSQFQSLHQTRQNDLVTEFSVIRASQRPEAVLKGIHAEDIHFRNFSADNVATYGTATTVDEPARQSPPASPEASGSTSPSRHARRESRIHENFSRPASKYPRSCPTTPPPPVVAEVPDESAEPAPRAIDEILGLTSAQSYSDEFNDSVQYTQLQLTPEATDGRNARTLSLSSHYDLEDVPEEEEATRFWDSPDASIGCVHSRSVSQVSQPAIRSRTSSLAGRKAPLSIYVAEELSRKFSEALGSPTLPQTFSSSPPRAHVKVTPPSVPTAHQVAFEDEIYDSWDADIDYCYEHAAESTSNFDWSRTSPEEAQYPQIGIACSDDPWLGAPKTRHLQPSPLSTSMLPTPDLETSPARLSVVHAAATPSTAEYEHEFMASREDDYFQPVNSSIVPSALGKQMNQETMYEEYLTTDAESDRHFTFPQGMVAQSENNTMSERSSFSPISKCNSQESLMLSRAASIARKHRSSVSTTSVPELIHSLSSSRELMATDRMTADEALSAGNSPALPSHHRQTKSLAEAHLLLHAGSNSNLSAADLALPTTISHDRTKSASDVDTRAIKTEESTLPPLPSKNPNRKKSRAPSYSLFPTAAH